MKIAQRNIGPGHPCYIIAEMSANHGQDFDLAMETVRAMKEAGADAIKVQTYTADTLTLACDRAPFVVKGGTLWDGRTLHSLYQEGSMPWEWQPKLQAEANALGMDFFSTPFDNSAVDFLEQMQVPVHKIASFEMVDLLLLRKVAATGKPIIMSTGMATLEEIEEAMATLRAANSGPVALLKCTSSYPAAPEEMNLLTIPDLAKRFGVIAGLSDHTPGHTVAVTAVALGAAIVEKHFVLSRDVPGPDTSFSMEPAEFLAMVQAIRMTEKALGKPSFGPSSSEAASLRFRRSLFVSEDVRKGEPFTAANVRSVRPAGGLHTRHFEEVVGRTAAQDIERGTPLAWNLVAP